MNEREIRKLIYKAREKGEPICSSCDKDDGGYYYPLNVGEAMIYILQQRERVKSGNAALSAVMAYAEREGLIL